MKCPYPHCQKDYNDESWPPAWKSFVTPESLCRSIAEQQFLNRIYLISRQCRFCNQLFHEVYIGHLDDTYEVETDFLASYPCSKTKFEAVNIPKNIRDCFNEAERCRSVGSLTGVGACLRKTIYAVCDDKETEGRDYREKIMNLSVKETYQELLKQIKWLGDNTTKPGEEKYSMNDLDLALEILPILIDELYSIDDKIEKVTKVLAKVRSKKA